MNTTTTLREAKRLYRLGFAIIWLHPKSKRPIGDGWTTGPRKDWKRLQSEYAPGVNIGVRLGAPSQIGKGYLAVVDVDVKSGEKRHRKEALAAAKKLLAGQHCPTVLSGRGGGSRHYYCVTEKPFKTWNAAGSEEYLKYYSPSKAISKRDREELSQAELDQGYRHGRAWEVSLYSDGRQVVLPPSIHPDSNRPYSWAEPVTTADDLPALDFGPSPEKNSIKDVEKRTASPLVGDADLTDFAEEPVMIEWLDISEKVREGILTGRGVKDRSAFLLPASTALLSAGLTKNEILSVLTDPKTFLGACAYEHAQTKSRARAARWVWRYTLARVMEERDAVSIFKSAAKIEPNKKLSKEEREVQDEEIEADQDWRKGLEATQQGKYRATLANCIMMLTNVAGKPGIVGRNEFAGNDYYLVDTPWRSKKGDPVTDIDIVRIKKYFAHMFGVEFSDNPINQALMSVADENRYHPVRDWVRGLKWDGVARIDTWLKDYAGAVGPEPYLSDVSRKFLVAMIARVFRPGVKFDTILILEGNQGTGKSTLLSKLCGEDWFTDAPIKVGDKDGVLTIQAKWLIELGELSSMSKADLEVFKVFISQRQDRIRSPYGKRVEEFPRQIVFAGTTNLDEYLRDLTGNRRFWSVKLTRERIDFDGIEKIRGQLFAEAYQHFILGEELYLCGDEATSQAVLEQAKRLHSDEWMPAVQDIVNGETFAQMGFEMRDVAKRLDQFGAHRLSPTDVHRISRCLKLLGFEKFQEAGGQRRKLWRATKEFTPLKNGHANGLKNGHDPGSNGTARNHAEPRLAVRPKPATKADHRGMEPRNRDFL
jgi:predicted P-loop ATPase